MFDRKKKVSLVNILEELCLWNNHMLWLLLVFILCHGIDRYYSNFLWQTIEPYLFGFSPHYVNIIYIPIFLHIFITHFMKLFRMSATQLNPFYPYLQEYETYIFPSNIFKLKKRSIIRVANTPIPGCWIYYDWFDKYVFNVYNK